MEKCSRLANEQGTRALGDLRGGVERALQILGEGFTSHPKNAALRDALRTGQVPLADFHGQLLRVVYRLIFLFVAEGRTIDGRSLLHPRDDSDAAQLARERYAAHYSTARLRDMAAQIKGSRHGDLWRQFHLLTGALSGQARFAGAREHLALPVLGSFLWDPASTAVLNKAELTNHDFLEALRNLAFTRQGKVLRPVDYKTSVRRNWEVCMKVFSLSLRKSALTEPASALQSSPATNGRLLAAITRRTPLYSVCSTRRSTRWSRR